MNREGGIPVLEGALACYSSSPSRGGLTWRWVVFGLPCPENSTVLPPNARSRRSSADKGTHDRVRRMSHTDVFSGIGEMTPKKPGPDNTRLDRVVAEARRASDER